MKPAALAGVMVLAKVIGLSGRDLPLSVWLPSVFLWDDVAIGVALLMVDRLGRRPGITTVLYWTVVAWAALNVPVMRALASPLTTNMIGATGGALLDSITHYLTWSNGLAVTSVFIFAALLPAVLARVRPRLQMGAVFAAIVLAAPGPFLANRVDAHGLQRNAVTALIRTSLPRVESRALTGDWRASPFGAENVEALGVSRGAGAGRNVVVIVLESTASRYLRSYGASDDPTPNLTILGSNAIQFDHAYAVYPESIKGLFAALCSRAPAFDVSVEAHALAPCTPLARVLSTAGYRTALFHSGRFGYLGMDDVVSKQGFDTLEDAATIGGRVESSFGVDEPSTVSRMLTWIDAQSSDRPFFLTYLPTAGHHPYATAAPGRFAGPGDFVAYKNALHEGDRSVGALVDGIRQRQLDQRTIFVVFGDHGEAFGQHDGNFGHTLYIYDENVRVPLLVSIPGVTTGPRHVKNVASVLDIAPTILDLLGLDIPVRYEGQSLLTPDARMAFFYTDYSVGLVGLEDGCWKYHLDVETPRSRLFNTCADPNETRDLAQKEPERARIYAERVKAWSSATRAGILAGR